MGIRSNLPKDGDYVVFQHNYQRYVVGQIIQTETYNIHIVSENHWSSQYEYGGKIVYFTSPLLDHETERHNRVFTYVPAQIQCLASGRIWT